MERGDETVPARPAPRRPPAATSHADAVVQKLGEPGPPETASVRRRPPLGSFVISRKAVRRAFLRERAVNDKRRGEAPPDRSADHRRGCDAAKAM